MTKVAIAELIDYAKAGKVVSFPTDTVPALAVVPNNSQLIFSLKKRPQNKPLILMAASIEELMPYLTGSDSEKLIWQEVAQKYWPGALTLVLRASQKVPKELNPTDPTTIGLRVPDSLIALSILKETGPLATTSANLSGVAPLETMDAIEEKFSDVLTLDFDRSGQKLGTGLPSTVAKWTTEGWQILRTGSIKAL